MSNNEFSSVEWLYNKMVIKLCNKLQTIEYTHIFLDELEQAKAKHKQEFVDFALFYTFGRTDMVAMRKYCEKLYDEKFNND